MSKDLPILFKGSMVRALVADTKTQTRRALYVATKSISRCCFDKRYPPPTDLLGIDEGWTLSQWRHVAQGDTLWVREKFQPMLADGVEHWDANWKTGAGYAPSYPATDGIREFIDLEDNRSSRCWPAIHMPRWASRISLEVTGIRVERLKNISEADALAEGIVPLGGGFGLDDGSHFHPTDPRRSYLDLWEEINGPGSVSANPWLTVIEFRRTGT